MRESEKSILGNHRKELEEIMRGGERMAVLKSLDYSDRDNRSAYSHLCNLSILLCKGEVYIDGKSFSKLLKN